jgi:hypothetical protein
MKQVTYWLNRKAFRDSVDYGTTCPSDDCLSLGDSVWTRTVDSKTGFAEWNQVKTTRVTANGTMAIDTWDASATDKVVLDNTKEV